MFYYACFEKNKCENMEDIIKGSVADSDSVVKPFHFHPAPDPASQVGSSGYISSYRSLVNNLLLEKKVLKFLINFILLFTFCLFLFFKHRSELELELEPEPPIFSRLWLQPKRVVSAPPHWLRS